jgi:uncharacterized protein
MFKRLLPTETSFFDYFERHTKLGIETCRELHGIAEHPNEMLGRTNRIKELEHEADNITHGCIDALHRTFITPIDRADIHRLMKRLDDIVDEVDSAASRLVVYELSQIRPEMVQLTQVLVRASVAIDQAIHHLRDLRKGSAAIEISCRAVYDAENEGDQILRAALVRLFKEEKDPVLVIKWKEVLERLERATDRCEEVANIVQGIVIEAS